MRQKKTVPGKPPSEDMIRDIRRATRRHFSAEEKIRIVLEGLRDEESIAENRDVDVLRLVQGVPGGGEETPGGRYEAGGHFG